MSKFITSFKEDTTKWYTDIINKAELVDYGLSKGTIILRPYGFKIWKNIQILLTKYFDDMGVEEIYFPLLIPYSELEKEKKHIEGFAPEVFTVTRIGNKEIQPLVIRPTSEILFTKYFKDNVKSHKQLPILLNQWVNIMRGEKNTRPFLRTSEFLWQEGHTLHETKEEALKVATDFFNLYKNFFNNHLDIYVLAGEKTQNERFAGAENTFTIETILKDGKALQSGTSHYLGKTFTESFGVKIQDKEQKEIIPHQTSWGVSTRMIGAIIMSHSDDDGLVLPWDVAPYNIVILTVGSNEDPKMISALEKLSSKIKSLNLPFKIDNTDKGIGFKSNEWEIKGIPMRIEIGNRDLANNKITIVNRYSNEKNVINLDDFNSNFIENFKENYKKNLYEKTKQNTFEKIIDVDSLEQLEAIINQNKVARVFWHEDSTFEKKLQNQIEGATVRMIWLSEEEGKCVHSGVNTKYKAIISKAY